MRILLISTYFRPDLASTGVLMTDLARELAALGNKVTVVTSKPHYGGVSGPSDFPGFPWAFELQLDGTCVYRLSVFRPGNRGALGGRMLNYLAFEALSSLLALGLPRPDVVLIPSPPLMNGLVGDLIRRVRKVPFVYNVQDIWPEFPIQAGAFARGSTIARLAHRLEDYVYDHAARLVVISEEFRDRLHEKGVSPARLCVIPNFFDVDFLQPLPKNNAFARKHGLDERFVALFAGNVGRAQDLNAILDAARSVEDVQDLLFLIVGDGAAKEELQVAARRARLTNVRFLPFQEHELLPQLYGSADVGLVPLRAGFEEASVPCKVYSIMASGTPVLASVAPGGSTARLVESVGAGLVVGPGDSGGFRAALLRLYGDQALRAEMGARGRAFVCRDHTPRRIAERYAEVLGELAG